MRVLTILSYESTRMALQEDQNACSRNQRVFLNVFQPKLSELMLTLISSRPSALHDSDWQRVTAPLAVYHLDGELEAAQQRLVMGTSRSSNHPESDAAAICDALVLMFAAYAIVCSCLHISRVCVDLHHILAVARLRRIKPFMTDQFASFIVNAGQCRHFEVLPSVSYDGVDEAWTMEHALEYARKSQTLELLVEFCSASSSSLGHKCLKELCDAQTKLFMNPKDTFFNTRAEVSRQFETLHLFACERCISEMIGLLRELPLVLQFKHSIRGTEAITSDAFGLAKDVVEKRFELYLKAILANTSDVSENQASQCQGGSCARFWRHASREARVQSRCLRLKTRIMWHLRQLATSDEQSLLQVFERVFLIGFLSGRCGDVEEAKLIAKFIDKAQDAVSCGHWRQSKHFAGDQQQSFTRSSQSPIHSRRDKIVRSVALITWAIWVRERCAYCLRSLELLQGHDRLGRNENISDAERKRVGSLAATCALQLNSLGALVAKPDDIFAHQISLLEESAKLNREKAIAVICWAFPADKVQARYLKRYKALRQALKADASEQRATDTPTIEETEQRCQFIQRHMKKSIRWSITSGSMKSGSMYTESPKKHEMSRSWTAETDVLVDSCCNLDFQKLTWALVQKRFVGGSKSDPDPDAVGTKRLKNVLLQSRDSTTEGAVSRHEVIALLQEQKRELEEKVRTWSASSPAPGDEISTLRSSHQTLIVPQGEARAPTAAAEQAASPKLMRIRDIDFGSDSEAPDDANRKRKQSQRTERRESMQNVLKLLSLRKQHDAAPVRSDSSPDLLRRVDLQISRRVASTGCAPSGFDGVLSPKRHAREVSRHGSVPGLSPPVTKTQESRSPSAKRGNGDAASPIFPLRYGVGVESAGLQLLDWKHSGGRTVPLKTRQFSFQRQVRASTKTSDQVHAPVIKGLGCELGGEQGAAELKCAGVQTDRAAEILQTQAQHSGVGHDDSIDGADLRSDAATQSETVTQCASGDTSVAAVQCSMTERGCREADDAERVRSVTEGVLSKFPIFIDLDSSTPTPPPCGLPKQRYLQVVRFTDRLSSEQDRRQPIKRIVDAAPACERSCWLSSSRVTTISSIRERVAKKIASGFASALSPPLCGSDDGFDVEWPEPEGLGDLERTQLFRRLERGHGAPEVSLNPARAVCGRD
ncbi:hypothetical protein PybrP1_002407 [[Pythium] brassicae (nom. inval.)]|nr:hypothetical protein PybrP1_002407 [[Pythium] brassicae (nom. inval.)]